MSSAIAEYFDRLFPLMNLEEDGSYAKIVLLRWVPRVYQMFEKEVEGPEQPLLTSQVQGIQNETLKRKSMWKKDNLKKATTDVSSSKQDYHQSNSNGKDIPGYETAPVINSSLPGISLTMDSGKKKILLLKPKVQDNPDNPPSQQEQHTETNLSTASRQNQKIDVSGRLIQRILLKNDSRPSQSSTFIQSEQRVNPLSLSSQSK